MNIQLYNNDCLIKLKELEENSIDSIVTDPPYEISFMSKGWDGTGIAFNQEVWKECLRVLKPGGHILSFGATRTYHRMTVAIEDAGFEIRDCLFWCYGSGFPKSHNIGKAVDKLEGNEREVVGENPNHRESDALYELGFQGGKGDGIITKGNSPYEGFGTALKPAVEPVVMGRKPFKGNVAGNVLEWGTGGLNIDDCRIEGKPRTTHKDGNYTGKYENASSYKVKENSYNGTGPIGRWPANLILDEEAGRMLDEQSGNIKGCKAMPPFQGKPTNDINFTSGVKEINRIGYNDNGGASRFFYCPKVSKTERNEGCDELEEKQRPAQTDKGNYSSSVYCKDCGKTYNGTNDHRNCTDGVDYRPSTTTTKNNHPTVKPVALLSYLIRLVTPKGGTVLDPFMGSGSTGKAAIREGMGFVGIEKEEEYFQIAQSRIEHEAGQHKYREFF